MAFPRFFSWRTVTNEIDTPIQLAPPGMMGRVLITAETDNTGLVAIGGEPDVLIPEWQIVTNGPRATAGSQEGFPLNAGENMPYPVELSEVWLASAVAGDGVTWLMIGDK